MSLCSQPPVASSESPWSESTEISESSGSSSTQSWLDEAEESLTRDLKDQYEKFEEALYCERPLDDLPKGLQAEVKIWSEHSPHIRVRGVKAELHERPDGYIDPEEEGYSKNYEEVLESHGSLEETLEKSLNFNEDIRNAIEDYSEDEQEFIKADLKNAIVGKLFGQALPRVLEKVEPVIKSVSAAGKRKKSSVAEKAERYLAEKLKNRENEELSAAARSKSGRGHASSALMKRKPLPLEDGSSYYQSALSSRGLRTRAPHEPDYLSTTTKEFTSSLRIPDAKISRTSSFSAKRPQMKLSIRSSKVNCDKNSKKLKEEKSTMLPIIEAVSIAPKESPDKRAASAMMRFNKTLPRVGPNTSRQKSPAKKSSSRLMEPNNNCARLQSSTAMSSTDPSLQVVGTRSATSVRSNKWRY